MRPGLAALALAIACCAEARADSPARWYLQVDNDVVYGTDRWYSSGVRIARVTGTDVLTEWGVLQEVYTPEAKRWAPGIDDRAPTARLLLYGARHWLIGTCIETIEVGVGVRGPSALGRESTDAVHQLVPAPEVDWSREQGDRIDAQAVFARSVPQGGLHVHFGAVAGSQQAFAHGGVEWRAGSGARGALSPALRFAATPPPAAGASGWAAFLGASVRAVARNAMVARNYDPFGPGLDPRRVVGRAAAGMAWVDSWGSVTFALAHDTREFAAQRRAHGFGSLTVHVEF